MFKEFFMFGVVGTVGFLVDAGVLYLLKASLGLYAARIASFICAASATWILNRLLTFNQTIQDKPQSPIIKEYLHYFASMLVGGAFNFATYSWFVSHNQQTQSSPLIGVALGSIVGMLINFLLAKHLVFKK